MKPTPLSKIQFSLLSPEVIRDMSVCEIKSVADLKDPRMGVETHHDKGKRCQTCDQTWKECPGHFGHLELAKAVFYVEFMPKIMKILRCFCHNPKCKKLLLDRKLLAHNNLKPRSVRLRDSTHHARLDQVYALCKGKRRCGKAEEDETDESDAEAETRKSGTADDATGCGKRQPQYKLIWSRKEDKEEKRHEEEEEEKPRKGRKVKRMSAEEVYERFKEISDEDCLILGIDPVLSRPEWMICKVLPIPPPSIRPELTYRTKKEGTRKIKDDLTHILENIVVTNKTLKETISIGGHYSTEAEETDRLQALIGNWAHGSTVPNYRGKTFDGLKQRISGKKGRIRRDVMGKRVNFCARSVITPDPNIPIGTVGIPKSMTVKKSKGCLTVPDVNVEVVTPENMDRLQQEINQKPPEGHHRTVYQQDGTPIEPVTLLEGDRVVDRFERPLKDGDVVVMNRNPSLHKMSMMGHRVKVIPGSTFRLNLAATSPYNADFDGDEMNLHVPQKLKTKIEIMELAMVSQQLIAPHTDAPAMGVTQDALVGIHLITRRDTFLPADRLMDILMNFPQWNGERPMPAILKPKPLWTGKQLVSMVIPRGTDLLIGEQRDDDDEWWRSQDDAKVIIRDGHLLTGRLCANTLGPSKPGTIQQKIATNGQFYRQSSQMAADFLDNIQLVSNAWFLDEGFSIGIGDLMIGNLIRQKIEETLQKAEEKIRKLNSKAQKGSLKTKVAGRTIREEFECRAMAKCTRTREKCEEIAVNSLPSRNAFLTMVSAGSKGSKANICQTVACVGQQIVGGERIPFGGMLDTNSTGCFRGRTLPHYRKYEYEQSPASRGFIRSSLLGGLKDPKAFFFYAMSGREGLVKAGTEMADPGYLRRKLGKFMENLMLHHDGTVRNNMTGAVIQWCYGEAIEDKDAIWPPNLAEIAETNGKYNIIAHPGEMVGMLAAEALSAQNSQMTLDARHGTSTLDGISRMKELVDAIKDPKCPSISIYLKEKFCTAKQKAMKVLCKLEFTNLRMVTTTSAVLVDPPEPPRASRLARYWRTFAEYMNNNRVAQKHIWLSDDKVAHRQQQRTQRRKRVALQQLNTRAGGHEEDNYWLSDDEDDDFDEDDWTEGEAQEMMLRFTMDLMRMKSRGIRVADVKASLRRAVIGPSKKKLGLKNNGGIAAGGVCFEMPKTKGSSKKLINKSGTDEEIVDEMNPMVLLFTLDRTKMDLRGIRVAHIEAELRRVVGPFKNALHLQTYGNVIGVRFSADEFLPETKGPSDQWMPYDGDELVMYNPCFMEWLRRELLDRLRVQGYEAVERVQLQQVDPERKRDDDQAGRPEYMIRAHIRRYATKTDKVLLGVLGMSDVDSLRTCSDNVHDVLKVLGIEAARSVLYNELRKVIMADGNRVAARHLQLLCDNMTVPGYVAPNTRHNIRKQQFAPMMRATFEEPLKNFVDAAVHAEQDPINGVSQQIMLGQLSSIGTGCFDVIETVPPNHDNDDVPPPFADDAPQFVPAGSPYCSAPSSPAATSEVSSSSPLYLSAPNSPSICSSTSPFFINPSTSSNSPEGPVPEGDSPESPQTSPPASPTEFPTGIRPIPLTTTLNNPERLCRNVPEGPVPESDSPASSPASPTGKPTYYPTKPKFRIL